MRRIVVQAHELMGKPARTVLGIDYLLNDKIILELKGSSILSRFGGATYFGCLSLNSNYAMQ